MNTGGAAGGGRPTRMAGTSRHLSELVETARTFDGVAGTGGLVLQPEERVFLHITGAP